MDPTTTANLTATALLRERHTEVKGMFDELLQSNGNQRQELFDCLRATLAVHETAEEIVIHPRVRSFGAEAAKAVDARLAEEKEAKRVLADLERMGADDPTFLAHVGALREAAVAHAEAEEREIFPRIEERCSLDEQRSMGERIRRAERLAPTHPHPHGPSGGVGNMLVGPFAAMVDKVRDAISE